jgi:hypothetical protein
MMSMKMKKKIIKMIEKATYKMDKATTVDISTNNSSTNNKITINMEGTMGEIIIITIIIIMRKME